ncbi:hypothetical protein CN425_02580 [Bacillus cereus]|uniref:Uncharacterized protein n=1 Tax=Bacillus cereus TaxID=1396 RepID=A0A2A8Q119_BACCE|nr:hypothetical protein [Bacillus cereus]PEA06868.1 hypothetical protein CON38_25670 [Bacillus cereus]PEW06062.1 hypothetical protein CN425_02580 [Bacillus cereus]
MIILVLPSFPPAPLNPSFNTLAAPYYSAKSTFTYASEGVSTSDAYISSSKASKKQINYIYAKAKVYVNVNGVYKKSASEGNYNSSHAGAQTFAGETWFEDGETYGT